MPIQSIRSRRLYQQIAEQVLGMIEAGEYRPGDRLPPEHDLARDLKVSRPSVREAMIVLETAGVVEVRTGSGSFVREPTLSGWRLPWSEPDDPGPGPLEWFKGRLVLEPALAAEAAREATAEEIARLSDLVDRIEAQIQIEAHVGPDHFAFHEELAIASHNSVLARFARELIDVNQTAIWRKVRDRIDTFDSLTKGVESRRRIVEALRARDPRAAEEAMRGHLRKVGRAVFGADLESEIIDNQGS